MFLVYRQLLGRTELVRTGECHGVCYGGQASIHLPLITFNPFTPSFRVQRALAFVHLVQVEDTEKQKG